MIFLLIRTSKLRSHRLTVRTDGFQSSNRGSIPRGTAKFYMKLLRVGNLKQEKPAIIDKFGLIRDLSSLIEDLNDETINQGTIELINKTDLSKKSQPISDFYKLGIKDVLLISAKNNTGLSELKDKISLVVTGEEIVEKDIFRRVSIIGKPNA